MSFFRKKIKVDTNQVSSRISNIDYNRNLWDTYSQTWSKDKAEIEDKEIRAGSREDYIEFLGDEWGDKESVQEVLNDFLFPFISGNSVVAEIGSGGGRIAAVVAPRVEQLYCFDISRDMLSRASKVLSDLENISFILSNGKSFEEKYSERFDFVYSFDVFVHLDLHTIWSYFSEFRKILKKEGLIFLHTSNLKAPGGWERFASQQEYKVEGHYFISPEIVNILAEKAGFDIVKRSEVTTNFYYKRDYLFILKKRE
jgi:SAM-dependent methyltransferase